MRFPSERLRTRGLTAGVHDSADALMRVGRRANFREARGLSRTRPIRYGALHTKFAASSVLPVPV